MPLAKEKRMINLANHHRSTHPGSLGMTLQAEDCIPLHEQLAVHRSMREVTGNAPFPHRLVLMNKMTGLLTMALRAGFIQSGHSKPTCRLHDIVTMWIMTVHATHLVLEHGMMRGQAKLGVHSHMTLEAGLRRFTRIHNQAIERGASS